jgi:hypothetical protein
MTLMTDDPDLEKAPEPQFGQPSSGGPPLAPVAIGGALLVLFIAAGAWWMSRRAEAPAATNQSGRAVTGTESPIEKPAEPPVVLPPLAEMDAFLRPLLSALSSRPELARWLATDDLIRQLAAAIDQAADGNSPARDFKILAPQSPLATTGRAGQRTIDPNSYRRYDGLVATITSMDASGVARIYHTIKPRLNEAYQSMGNPNREVDAAVQNAIDILLDTPVVEGPIRVVEGDGASWVYADRQLEALLPTQKQVLRMGPAHAEKLLTWLRAFKDAL